MQSTVSHLNEILKKCKTENSTIFVTDAKEVEGSIRFYLNRVMTKEEWNALYSNIPIGAEKHEEIVREVVGTSTQRRKRFWIEYPSGVLHKPVQVVTPMFKVIFFALFFMWFIILTLYLFSRSSFENV